MSEGSFSTKFLAGHAVHKLQLPAVYAGCNFASLSRRHLRACCALCGTEESTSGKQLDACVVLVKECNLNMIE